MATVIAVDAMGSDRAPKPELEGAQLAVREYGVEVVLVGRKEELRAALGTSFDPRISIVNATEVIGMEEKAVAAVKSKRDSSMRVGLRMVRDGQAQGFVSAGNTGAAMAAAKIVLGGIPGVDRPALAAVFPTAMGAPCIMLDVGANVDCKPHNLVQFAVMGEIYYRKTFGNERPRVGILSVGEEESKGNEQTRAALPLLKQLPLNFVGNVEGRDLYNGHVEVIVCDGFIGNVALKVSEGLVTTVSGLLRSYIQAHWTRKLGYVMARGAFKEFRKRLDYSDIGGAPLLGVKGVCIIGHGSSSAGAIKNAIRVAAECADRGVNRIIEQELAAPRAAGSPA
jgi:glycerol-3-phosphate acyltransferase PlsX